MKILLVDDSYNIRKRIIKLINSETSSLTIIESPSISDAMEKIPSDQPDIIILDIMFPDGSGISILKLVKERYPSIQVIVLTNYTHDYIKNNCELLGADYFLDKSLEFCKINKLLNDIRLRVCEE